MLIGWGPGSEAPRGQSTMPATYQGYFGPELCVGRAKDIGPDHTGLALNPGPSIIKDSASTFHLMNL